MPGIGEVIEGAMQHAPQFDRQSMDEVEGRRTKIESAETSRGDCAYCGLRNTRGPLFSVAVSAACVRYNRSAGILPSFKK